MRTNPSPIVDDDRLLSPKEVASKLSVSARTVWSLTAGGQLPALKIGRCVRYKQADVRTFIDGLAAKGVRP